MIKDQHLQPFFVRSSANSLKLWISLLFTAIACFRSVADHPVASLFTPTCLPPCQHEDVLRFCSWDIFTPHLDHLPLYASPLPGTMTLRIPPRSFPLPLTSRFLHWMLPVSSSPPLSTTAPRLPHGPPLSSHSSYFVSLIVLFWCVIVHSVS